MTSDVLRIHPLRNGDRLKQPEFHRRYEAHSGPEKFELIGGLVYQEPRRTYPHARLQSRLCFTLGTYDRVTPGVETLPGVTVILNEDSEPRPDLTLRILREYGGASWVNADDYIEGSPELLAEIAYHSDSIDLHQKHDDYQRAGVQEYLVVCIEEKEIRWFDFAAGDEIHANRKGVFCSRIFPGLWIDGPALIALNADGVDYTLQQGLSSRAHATFVCQLARKLGG